MINREGSCAAEWSAQVAATSGSSRSHYWLTSRDLDETRVRDESPIYPPGVNSGATTICPRVVPRYRISFTGW